MSSLESLTFLLTTNIASLYVKPEPSLTVSDTTAHHGDRGRPGTFFPHVSRPLSVRPFPFAIVPAPRMNSLLVPERSGGRAATSAKVLILGRYLSAVALRAETPVRGVDDGRDDDICSSVGTCTVGRGYTAGFLFFRLDLPLPPPMTVEILPRQSTTPQSTRDRACTVLAAEAAFVAGGIVPPGFISRHHSSNVRRNRIFRSSSGSRGPGPPNLNLSASLLFALPPPPSPLGQRERRGVWGRWGRRTLIPGAGISSLCGTRSISFRPPRRSDPLLSSFAVVIRTFGYSLRALLGQSFHRFSETADLYLQKANLPPLVCTVLFFLTMGRFCVLHGRLFVDRSGLCPVASRIVAAFGTAVSGSGGGDHGGDLGVRVGVGVHSAPRASLLPFMGSRSWCLPEGPVVRGSPLHLLRLLPLPSNPSGAADSLASRSTGMRPLGTLAQIPYPIGHVSMGRGSCLHRPDREDDNLYRKSLTLSSGARRRGTSQSRALRGGWLLRRSLAANRRRYRGTWRPPAVSAFPR